MYIFECEWLIGNLNDLCTAKLPLGCSYSNSNANGNWGRQNAHMTGAAKYLRRQALDAGPPPFFPNFLHFHAVVRKCWPNNSLAPSLVLAPSLGNPRSAADGILRVVRISMIPTLLRSTLFLQKILVIRYS